MPTYEYKCLECGNVFEEFQTMNAQPIQECPSCKSPVEKLIGTGAGVIYKGSGFYSTDYRESPAPSSSPPPASQGGGCGPGCGCVSNY